jgi:hypothetical protein
MIDANEIFDRKAAKCPRLPACSKKFFENSREVSGQSCSGGLIFAFEHYGARISSFYNFRTRYLEWLMTGSQGVRWSLTIYQKKAKMGCCNRRKSGGPFERCANGCKKTQCDVGVARHWFWNLGTNS